MKKTFFTTLLAVAFAIGAVSANADMVGKQMMGQKQQTDQTRQEGRQQMLPGMMMGNNSGIGMMRSGMAGPWMMGGNAMRMMGPGMAGGGMMMGTPMMGFAAGLDSEQIEKYEKFMKETKELRRNLHDMRFEYGEALWNPDTTLKDLRGRLKDMNQLQQKIQQKMPH